MPDEVKRYNVTRAHIAQTATRHDNMPYIIDSDVRVHDVYIWHELFGVTAEEIAIRYNLGMSQIYAALTFAYDHLDEIEQYIDREQQQNAANSARRHVDDDHWLISNS